MNKPSILREVNLKTMQTEDSLALFAQHPNQEYIIDEWLVDSDPRPTYAIYLAEATMLAYGRAEQDVVVELLLESTSKSAFKLCKFAGDKYWRWEGIPNFGPVIENSAFLDLLANAVSVHLVLPED